MEADYTDIISRIKIALDFSPHQRITVAIAGPPGSGKTTIARRIVHLLNKEDSRHGLVKNSSTDPFAISVSVDGFHFTRKYLDSLPDRDEAYVRRGAPWTFDVDGIVELAESLQNSGTAPVAARRVIKAPSFDHAMKDPVVDDIKIAPETSIIILEGNYLLLDEKKWRDLSPLVDTKIFVDVDVECARNRVARRHMAAGIESTYQRALARFNSNDALNGDLIRSSLMPYCVRIESFDTIY